MRPLLAIVFALFLTRPVAQKHLLQDNAQWTRAMARGNDAVQARNFVDAQAAFLSAVQIAKSFEKDDPKGAAKSWWSLANADLTLGKKDKAEDAFSRALSLEEKAPDADESQVAGHFRAVGLFYAGESKWTKAKKVYERALEHDKSANEILGHDADWKSFAEDQLGLANATLHAGDPAAASVLFTAAKTSYAKTIGGVETDEDRRFISHADAGLAACPKK